MKKYKLARKSKKIFAAMLAASLMLTSVAPGAVYASETEISETAMQSEEATEAVAVQSEEAPAQAVAEQEADPNTAEEAQPIAAETEATETEADTPEITEAPAEPETPVVTEAPAETEEQPTETPTEPATEETEQPTETETETSAESETETPETEFSEAVKALQERINALPTVEEFQAMADGTTVEDSTLNQKQMDVYNEAQAISDEYDKLSEEEKNRVDITKLKILFEYWNNKTELLLAATDFKYISVSDVNTYSDGSLKSVKISIKAGKKYADAYGKIAILNTVSQFDFYTEWFSSEVAKKGWPSLDEIKKKDSSVLSISNGEEFRWTDQNDHTLTVEFTKGQVNLTKSGKYYIYLVTRSERYGIYPDCLLKTLQSKGDGQLYDGDTVIKREHTHSWEYTAKENIITAKCTSESGSCEYASSSLTATLTAAKEVTYSGKPYDGIHIENNITSVTQEKTQISYVGYGGTNYISTEAPTNVGSYTVKVTIGGATASVNFKIAKADSTATVTPVQNLTYTGTDQTLVSADDITGGTIYYRVGEDGTWQDTLPTGVDAGEYEIFYYVKGNKNHKDNGSEDKPMDKCTVTVAKKQITASADGFEGTYDENASRSIDVKVTDPADGYKITYSTTGKEGSYTEENPIFTEVGEYTVHYQVEAGKNYQAAEGSATVKIAGAAFTDGDITASGYTGTYDGASHKISVEIKGTAAGATVTYSTTGEADSYKDFVPEFKDATNGIQKVYYKVSKKGYNDANGSVDVSIARKNVTATVSVKDKVYDGTTNAEVETAVNTGITNESLTVSGVTGTFASKDVAENIEVSVNSDAMTVAAGEGTKAENYNVSCKAKASGKIIAREAVLTWSKTELTYNGTKQSVTAQVKNLVSETDIFTLKYTGNTATNAGNYKAEVTALGNDNYVLTENSNQKTDWSIAKADAQYKLPEAISGLTYNGNNQELVKAGNVAGGTWMYKVGDGVWSDQLPTGLDAGTYEISYKVFGDANHNDSEEGRLTVSIAKKAVVISGITAENKIYDGNTSATLNFDSVKFDGLLEKDSLSVTASGAFEDKNAGQKKVLVSNLILDGISVKNYVLAKDGQQNETAATIKAKEIAAVLTPNGGIYEGTITPATAVLNGLVGEDKPEITLTYTGKANDGTEVGSDGKGSTEAPTHAGTYTVTASITDGNYHLKAEGSSAEFVVAKADPALTVSAVADKNYGEEAFKLETSNKGDGQKSYASSDEKVATVDENGLVTIVGAGAATLAVSLAESANYTASEKTVTVTVKKIDHSLVVEKLAYEVTYGDPSFSVVGQAGDTETAVKYISSNADVASVDENGVVTIKNAGEATITLEMDESGNYNAVSKAVTVTVHPKAVIVTPDNFTKVYDEADPELTYKADGLVGEDTLADIILTRAEGENVGTYDITAEAKEGANPNYSITCEKETFTITPKPIEKAEVTLGDALKYTGKEQTQNVAKVTLDGKEIPADAYTIEDNTATEAGTYTLTIKAKEGGNYTGTFTWTYVIAPTQDGQIKENADGSVKIGDGTLKMQVKTEGGVSSASLVTGKAQIIEMLIQNGDITADELAQIANGASVDIILTVKNGSATVSAEAKAQMESGANGYTIGQYLDISLFKYMTVNGVKKDGIQLRQTAGQITISVSIPEKLINTDSKVTRTYAVIRNHDGKVDIMNTTYDAASQTLTFQTNLFSDYAIAYQDVRETETETESETETETETKQTEKKSGTNGTSQTTAAKTADTTNVAGYGMALLFSVMAMAVILLKRRKRTEK